MSSTGGHTGGRAGRFPAWAIVVLAVLGAVVLAGAGVLGGLTLRNATSASGSGLSGSVSADSRSVCDAEKVAEDVLPSIVTIGVHAGDGSGGTGSGEIITADGYILTNNHVIAPAADGAEVVVLYNDGSTHPAKLVGRSPRADIAVIKVEGSGLPVIRQGDSTELKVGQPVVALGAPLGLSSTVTTGVVSALGRTVPVQSDSDRNAVLADAIQTDASINPGNSGGALVDCDGRLVGVNSAIATVPGASGAASSGSVGIGFAVPQAVAMPIAQQIIRTGKVVYPTFGLSVSPVVPGQNGEGEPGLYVQAVVPGGPAEQAGLQAGDIITKVDGRPVASVDDLTAKQLTSKPGDTVRITYVRDGKTDRTTVTLGNG
ncbi:S1C family serine protease [Leifsonia virtsii]|uniref:Trypsin-like peptidase domain-containing protein n=1 Tax=Leifsonia virtsii TaxID=3035915 RepID=A0ABT8IZG4_9MICO|nr:trypsin-like peptidase domain-containing protein [Leifsonia virtsii]MDN4598227.1 trypsin-like peptidase domain-containing protein [Leifsonia virtsii]